MEVSQIGSLFLGVPIARIRICWGLFWGSPFMETSISGPWTLGLPPTAQSRSCIVALGRKVGVISLEPQKFILSATTQKKPVPAAWWQSKLLVFSLSCVLALLYNFDLSLELKPTSQALAATSGGRCADSPRRRHEENEPRSVGTPKECSRHDCAAASGQPRCCAAPPKLPCKLRSRPAGLPVTLSVPKHGDFPRSMLGSKLPVRALCGRASPAS